MEKGQTYRPPWGILITDTAIPTYSELFIKSDPRCLGIGGHYLGRALDFARRNRVSFSLSQTTYRSQQKKPGF